MTRDRCVMSWSQVEPRYEEEQPGSGVVSVRGEYAGRPPGVRSTLILPQ